MKPLADRKTVSELSELSETSILCVKFRSIPDLSEQLQEGWQLRPLAFPKNHVLCGETMGLETTIIDQTILGTPVT